jgi:hypothetical protein
VNRKISSAADAISALVKLKARSVPVRVNVSFPCTGLAFEGLLSAVDESRIELWGIGAEHNPSAGWFRIAPLSFFDFMGQLDEGENAISFHLTAFKKGTFENLDLPRITLNAEWPTIAEYPSAPN